MISQLKMQGFSNLKKLLLCSTVAASLAVVPGTATAQDSSGEEEPEARTLNTVTVTARKRDETILDVPLSVTAISGEALDDYGISDIRDIENFSPGLVIERGGSGAGGSVALRGVSTDPTQSGFSQTVSIAVDGVQVERPRVLAMGLLDVGQVEVLKGPQALFFGKNSPAGAISIKSARPTDEFEAFVRAGYETVGREALIDGYLSGPIGDGFGARLSLGYRDLEGWIKNTANDQTVLNNAFIFSAAGEPFPAINPKDRLGEKEFVGRLALEYDNGGAFDAFATIAISDFESDGTSRNTQLFDCGTDPASVTRGAVDPFGDCEPNDTNSVANFAPNSPLLVGWPNARDDFYEEAEQTLATLTWNYDFGSLTLTGVSGYFDSQFAGHDTFDVNPFNQLSAAEEENYTSFSQEFRLASNFDGAFNFMIGAFYQDSELEFLNASRILPLPPVDGTGAPTPAVSWIKPGRTDGTTYSLFAQGTFDITDQLELSGGLRWTEEERDSSLGHTYSHPLAATIIFPSPNGLFFEDDLKNDNVSPELTLSYKPNGNWNIYGSYRTGFKSGGMAHSATLLGYIPQLLGITGGQALIDYNEGFEDGFTFGPEEIEGFEGGVKYSNGSFNWNAAAYTYDYQDLQVSGFDAATVSFIINNAAEATVEGVETDFQYAGEDGLLVYGSLAYNKAEYEDFVTSCYPNQPVGTGPRDCSADGTQNLGGTSLLRAPEISANLGASKPVALMGGEVVLAGNVRYSDDYVAINNGDPRGIQDAYTTIDLSARVPFDLGGSEASIALIGRNLTDEYVVNRLSDKPGGNAQLSGPVNRGRQIAIEVTGKF